MIGPRRRAGLIFGALCIFALIFWGGGSGDPPGLDGTRSIKRARTPRVRPPLKRVGLVASIDSVASHQQPQQHQEPFFVAFIVPTTGRPSLVRAISSLINQTLPWAWRAIIVADGASAASLPAAATGDPRVTVLPIPLAPRPYPAAAVRNAALPALLEWRGAAQAPLWAAFLDDDDVVEPWYAAWLAEAAAADPAAVAVVFRMALQRRGRHIVLPPPRTRRLCLGWVGISFALRIDAFEATPFRTSQFEDFNVLARLFWAGRRVLLSEHVAYRVRDEPLPSPPLPGLERVSIVRSNATLALTCPK